MTTQVLESQAVEYQHNNIVSTSNSPTNINRVLDSSQSMHGLITPRAHARSGVKQSVLSVSLSVCVCVSSKFWADHDNEGSKHF